jgi:hypothetical protein
MRRSLRAIIRRDAINLIRPRHVYTEFTWVPLLTRSRESAVGTATGNGLDVGGVGVQVPVGSRILFSTASRPALEFIQPPVQRVPGVFPRGKATGA